MTEQLNLFDNQELQLSVIEGGKNQSICSGEQLKCFNVEFKESKYMTLEELFSGFDEIRIITYSYDVGFIDKIMKYFKYGQVLFGAYFLVEKDDRTAEMLANVYEATNEIKKYKKLTNMAIDEELELKVSGCVVDHRKIYLLKADDGRTRVVIGSANMSYSAWNGSRMESYIYDETITGYNEYMYEFTTAWNLSNSITPSIFAAKKTDDLVDGNSFLKEVKETKKLIVVKDIEPNIEIENKKYVIDHEKVRTQYKELLCGAPKKSKGGFTEISPETVEKINNNKRKLKQREITVKNKEESYPYFKFDLDSMSCWINNKKLNLNPSKEDIVKDIEDFIGLFENFNQFVGNTEKLKSEYFKLVNAIFCSVFSAQLRCSAKLYGLPVSALPLFLLIASETANSGKTFMIKAVLKMMTGIELTPANSCDFKKDKIKNVQLGVKRTPFFIDEMDKQYLSRIKDIIKNAEFCENNQLEDMPLIVFASNDVLKPEEPIRKRMMFFTVDGALPSDVDKTAFEGRGKSIIKKLGTGFYCEYLRKMMFEIKNEIDYISNNNELPDEYYTDLMNISSKVIVSIIKDFGFELPSYVRELSWKDDYAPDAKSNEAIYEIEKFCAENKKSCFVDGDKIVIEMNGDTNSKNKITSWKNILPAEMRAEMQSLVGKYVIRFDKKEYERKIGHRFRNNSIFGRVRI